MENMDEEETKRFDQNDQWHKEKTNLNIRKTASFTIVCPQIRRSATIPKKDYCSNKKSKELDVWTLNQKHNLDDSILSLF